MKKSNAAMWLVCLAAIPLTLFLGSKLSGRWYYLTSTLIIGELLIPFFMAFEGRRPQARELVLMAVLCALAVAARVAIPVPNFKAIYGIIMIAGIALGPQPGFLVGAIAALASNFFYAQGPYTPWQMMAYGMAGMLAGFLFRKNRLPRKPVTMAIAGFLVPLLVVGPLLDTCSLFLTPITLNVKNAIKLYTVGLPMNLIQSASTAVVMFLLGRPMLGKLERIQRKYGLLDLE